MKRTGLRRDEVFDVKLALDGTNVGRKLKILNISFTLPNDKDKCLSASVNFSLIQNFKANYRCCTLLYSLIFIINLTGMFYISNESYSEVKKCVQKIIKQVEDIGQDFVFKDVKHKVKFYMPGDCKILALVTGIKSAYSNNPCLYCICYKSHLHLKAHFSARSTTND